LFTHIERAATAARYNAEMKLPNLKKFEFTPLNILKLAGLGVAGILVLVIVFSLIGSFFKALPVGMPGMRDSDGVSVMPSRGAAQFYEESGAYDSAQYGGYAGNAKLSVRNVAGTMPSPMPPVSPQTTGDTAEDFEVTEYSASIESRDKEETCGAVAGLKARTYVVFESANEYDRGCNYSFKVKHTNVTEVLAFIESLNPKDLSENTYTIKNQVDDFTSETEILEKKLASIDETLSEAIAAYDDIQAVATANQDAESLARIIDSKIQLIERLTQERININEQLDRYARAKADQLDRLEYTHFSVSVYERVFVDGDELRDSWKESIRMFFLDMNQIAQDLTVNLLLLVFLAIQYILYFLIIVVIAKYVWKAVRFIWKR
jgi:hypothetical protein